MRRHTLQWGAAVAAMLILSGCTTSTVITDLQVALDAVTVALPVLAGLTGVPADVSTAVTNYVAAANDALGQASTILDGPGTDAEKATAIFALFSGIARPAIPAQYQALAQLVTTIATDVAAFLTSVPGQTPASAAHAMAAKSSHATKFSTADHVRLLRCRLQAAENVRKLANLRKR